MSKVIQEDLTELTKKVSHMGGLVEEALDRSLTALLDRDAELARQVIEGDVVVDELENEVEERCLDVLALRQPVARDLRYVAGILKINSDLERMADHATNIAEDVIFVVNGKIVRHHMVEKGSKDAPAGE